MSARQFHAKQEQHDGGSFDHSSLKITKNSTFIPRLPPSSSTGSSSNDNALTNKPHAQQQPPPRRPVIIYTHSPKVIHTHPRDFMALVQKLTGYTPPPQEGTQRMQERCGQGNNVEDNESANSVVTEEHGTSVSDVPQVNSCFVDNNGVGVASYRANTGFDNPYLNPTPVFSTNPNDFMCAPSTHQLPFYNNADTMFMNRNASLRVLKDYP
ncbi:VQ motif-containing protein 20 [Tanacetum coccineum]